MERYESDVAIIGGGIAGVVTALQLLDAGKSVAIFEREPAERFGGSALEAFGGLFFVDSPEQRRMKIVDSPEQAYNDWKSFARSSNMLPTASKDNAKAIMAASSAAARTTIVINRARVFRSDAVSSISATIVAAEMPK